MTVAGKSIPILYISIDVLRVKDGKISIGAVEWFDNGWINCTHWTPLPKLPNGV